MTCPPFGIPTSTSSVSGPRDKLIKRATVNPSHCAARMRVNLPRMTFLRLNFHGDSGASLVRPPSYLRARTWWQLFDPSTSMGELEIDDLAAGPGHYPGTGLA